MKEVREKAKDLSDYRDKQVAAVRWELKDNIIASLGYSKTELKFDNGFWSFVNLNTLDKKVHILNKEKIVFHENRHVEELAKELRIITEKYHPEQVPYRLS